MWPTAEFDPFDRHDLDRVDPAAILAAWDHPHRRVIGVGRSRVDLSPVSVGLDAAFFLGWAEDQPWFVVPSANGRSLRDVAVDLDAVTRAAAMTGVALDNWHHTHPHCSRCGTPTEVGKAGWVRVCPQDASEHYPRVDPAVIMLVVDDSDRALLGRRVVWPDGWYSTLAGFVEPGETFEQAVAREVAEESGVTVDPADVRYRGSQPWPFPSSIMVAFTASTQAQEPVADGDEMAEVRWWSRSEFTRACDAGELKVPPAVSVAHQLIRDWYGAHLSSMWSR